MLNIPNENKTFQVSTSSDLKGNVIVTKNMNFDEEGYISLSGATKAFLNEGIDANFDQASVVIYNGDQENYFMQTWDQPYNINTSMLSVAPTENTSTDNPAGGSTTDACWFGDKLVVAENTDVKYFDSGTNAWVDTNISLTAVSFSNARHIVRNFRNLGYLAISNANTVRLYSDMSATPTLVRTLTLPADMAVTCMVYFNQNLYIGTESPYGGEAYMFTWNGTGTAWQNAFKVDATEIFDICVFKDTPVLFLSSGEIVSFNGSGFSQLCAFPIFYTNRVLGQIRHNTLKANSDVLYISFADSQNTDFVILNQPTGIWCYDPLVGLYNKYSFSISTIIKEDIATTAVNTGTGQITTTNNWVTGTEVYYRDNGGTTLGGLTDETKYFVINVDSTHIKLATTLANANAGTSITLTGTGSNSQDLVFFPKTDYGATNHLERSMAFTTIDINVTYPQYGTDLIWSAEMNSRTLANNYGFGGAVSNYVEARGYYITPKAFSTGVTDKYNTFVLKWKPMQNELDKIIIKYRTTDDSRDVIDTNSGNWQITWTSSTTFTTTTTDWADAVAGDEVEVLSGAGGGLLAHISTISENAGTYTVTIDETFTDYSSGDKAVAVFRNWIKWKTITTSSSENTYGYLAEQLGAEGKFIQFKIECRGLGVKIEELKCDDRIHLPASR